MNRIQSLATMVERVVVGPMHTNSYIYSEWKKECILIDPGADADIILKSLTIINMKPRGILLTHGHIDHVSAALTIREHYRALEIPVQIAIHTDDTRFLGKGATGAHAELLSGSADSGFESLGAEIDALPDPDVVMANGDRAFDADLLVIHTPGHTAGSVCIYSETQGLVFSGDTLLFEDVGRTDLPGGDRSAILRSIRERLFVLPEETRVCPGHGPFTTIERELRHNPHFE